MNILLIGSGGREHALAWKLAQSPLITKLYCAPGNPGMAQLGACVALDVAEAQAVLAFCQAKAIDLVVVGPEGPLVAGLADPLRAAGLKVFGPDRYGAQLEGSKGFTKDLCQRYNIPTAAYGRFDDHAAALAYLKQQGAPIVIKADGLAAGKGVTVAMDMAEATQAIDEIFSGRFGEASCVIEEYLEGEEVSFFVLCDGTHVLSLASAQDHKRVGDGDTGPNTGGMGAYSPAPIMTPALCQQVMAEIIQPTVKALQAAGHPFQGVLFAGLMITKEGPKLIEYNVRFGDPETQVLMMRLKSDVLPLLLACAEGGLDKLQAQWRDEVAVTVVLAAQGYPGTHVKGSVIKGLDHVHEKGVEVFQAGTAMTDGELVAIGGRVLNVTALGETVAAARTKAYAVVDRIDWPQGFCRRDIGWRALASS